MVVWTPPNLCDQLVTVQCRITMWHKMWWWQTFKVIYQNYTLSNQRKKSAPTYLWPLIQFPCLIGSIRHLIQMSEIIGGPTPRVGVYGLLSIIIFFKFCLVKLRCDVPQNYDYSQIFHRKITAQTVAQLSWKIPGPANRRFSLDENLLKLCKNLEDINQSAVRSFLIILKGVIMTPGSQQPVTRAGVWVGPGWSPPPPLQLIRAEERQSVSAMGRAITPGIWWEHRVTVNVSEWDETWDVKMWCNMWPWPCVTSSLWRGGRGVSPCLCWASIYLTGQS